MANETEKEFEVFVPVIWGRASYAELRGRGREWTAEQAVEAIRSGDQLIVEVLKSAASIDRTSKVLAADLFRVAGKPVPDWCALKWTALRVGDRVRRQGTTTPHYLVIAMAADYGPDVLKGRFGLLSVEPGSGRPSLFAPIPSRVIEHTGDEMEETFELVEVAGP